MVLIIIVVVVVGRLYGEVDIVTCYGLDGPGFDSRQLDFLFSGFKRPGRDVDHSPPSNAEVRNELNAFFVWTGTSLSSYHHPLFII
jgi:hypothetical protein